MSNDIYINYLHKILMLRPSDGYHLGLKIDGIHFSEERDEIAGELLEQGFLQLG